MHRSGFACSAYVSACLSFRRWGPPPDIFAPDRRRDLAPDVVGAPGRVHDERSRETTSQRPKSLALPLEKRGIVLALSRVRERARRVQHEHEIWRRAGMDEQPATRTRASAGRVALRQERVVRVPVEENEVAATPEVVRLKPTSPL